MGGADGRTYLGKWWAPNRPNRRVFGTLSTTPEDMKLRLAGRLVDELGEKLVIRGRTSDGQPVTLLDCLCTSHTPGWSALYGSYDAQELKAGVVLLGGRARADPETRFRLSSVEITGLAEFASYRPFGVLSTPTDGMRETIEVEPARIIRMRHADVDIAFRVDAGESWSPMLATLETRARLDFHSPVPRTIEQWDRDYHWPAATLVSLALGRACHVSRLTVLESEFPKARLSDDGRTATPPPFVEVLRGRPLTGSSGAQSGFERFTLSDDAALESMLPRWLDAHQELRLPLNLYFSTVFAPFMYVESRFLNLVQAAEGYHRIRFAGCTGEDESVHADRLAAIYASIDDPDQLKWLKAKLGDHSNEPTLMRRLLDLTELARSRGVKMSVKEAKRFGRRVKLARDELSHGGLGRGVTLRGDYFEMEQRLKSVLQACWLAELGLSQGASAAILNRWC